MARSTTQFVCQSCGSVHRKWAGKCDGCGAWNSIVEEVAASSVPVGGTKAASARRNRIASPGLTLEPLVGGAPPRPRVSTGINELDRALGGGLVQGGTILIGGDPGIGKSTLLLQALGGVANAGHSVIYVSGEEGVDQIRGRAERLDVASSPVALAAATSADAAATTIASTPDLKLIVIDSIQTMYVEGVESAPGSVSQVRASAQILIAAAKRSGAALVLVGHVTKDGAIAGPRVLEHMVDAVLYFEGDASQHYRILRAVKNRFGPADALGVFEMTGSGLKEVPNPSTLFLSERQGRDPVTGAAVFAGFRGARPLLVEVQALVGAPGPASPRRAVVGWDSARLAMTLAVLESRAGLPFSGRDVFLSVAGGLKLEEPAADLAAAAALISALLERPVPLDCVFFGELALSGEARPTPQGEARLTEALRLGFARAAGPGDVTVEGIKREPIRRIDELVTLLAAQPLLRAPKPADWNNHGETDD
jgi:DNA repair protein RadA/Sms